MEMGVLGYAYMQHGQMSAIDGVSACLLVASTMLLAFLLIYKAEHKK
jgi:hypothetical protein